MQSRKKLMRGLPHEPDGKDCWRAFCGVLSHYIARRGEAISSLIIFDMKVFGGALEGNNMKPA